MNPPALLRRESHFPPEPREARTFNQPSPTSPPPFKPPAPLLPITKTPTDTDLLHLSPLTSDLLLKCPVTKCPSECHLTLLPSRGATMSSSRNPSGGSDAENHVPLVLIRPTPTILTSPPDLSPYRTVLPRKPPSPPSRRALRDAVRCARSGMVPGAMRKYLLARQHHVDTHEDLPPHGQVLQELLPPASPPSDVFTQEDRAIQDAEDSSSVTSFEEPPPSDYSDTHTRKRAYSEAFSPDTTTPTEGDVVTEKSERFEIHITTPAKPPTPSSSAPQKRRNSRKSSEEAAPSSPPKARRNLHPLWKNLEPRRSPYRVAEQIDLALEKSLSRNSWPNVIHVLTTNLETAKLLPRPRHLGLLIRKALLGIGVRVPRDTPASAQKFLNELVSVYPIDAEGDISTDYYGNVFTQSGDDEGTSLPGFLATVLDCIIADVRAGTSPAKALPFFKLLTRLVVTQYKAYEKKEVKVHRPLFVRFLEAPDSLPVGEGAMGLGYNEHGRALLRFMFALIDHPEELKPVLRWIGLLSHHLKVKRKFKDAFVQLVDDFVDTVSRPEYVANQVRIVQAIQDKSLGTAVCLALLMRTLSFEYVTSSDSSTLPTDTPQESRPTSPPTPEHILQYFKTIAKSDLIVGLKAALEEKSRVFPSTNKVPAPLSSPSPTASTSNRRRPSGVNMKGESHLHKLCARSSSSGLLLEKYLKAKQFHVNPRDNFGNTPLHDAVAHSRFDALTKFFEYSSSPSLPDNLRIDLLAQNNAGDNAFHLAASLATPNPSNSTSTPRVLVDILRLIGDQLSVTDDALKTLNNDGKMPFQMASSKEVREALLPHDGPEVVIIPAEVSGLRVASRSRVSLQSLEVKQLIALWSEFSGE